MSNVPGHPVDAKNTAAFYEQFEQLKHTGGHETIETMSSPTLTSATVNTAIEDQRPRRFRAITFSSLEQEAHYHEVQKNAGTGAEEQGA
jgi:hypothetical protein